MNTSSGSKLSEPDKKSKTRIVLPILALLLVLAIGVILASITRMVSISGIADRYVLKPNQIRMGILFIDNGAAAIFQEGSHWIGPIISKEGTLIVQDEVTITGPVVLFSNGLQLGKNAILDGSVVIFSGGLTLEPGASLRHNAVLFAGGLTLEPGASLRQNAVLFAGSTQIGSGAAINGKLISFFGGLDLASKAALHDDAILFFGNGHLYPGAQVRGDVILTDGDVSLDGPATIYGKLYLSPEPGWGRLSKASAAHITGGVFRPANIHSVASWQIGGWMLRLVLTSILVPVVVIGLLMALMFYLGRRSRSSKHRDEAKAHYPDSSPQATAPGLQ